MASGCDFEHSLEDQVELYSTAMVCAQTRARLADSGAALQKLFLKQSLRRYLRICFREWVRTHRVRIGHRPRIGYRWMQIGPGLSCFERA